MECQVGDVGEVMFSRAGLISRIMHASKYLICIPFTLFIVTKANAEITTGVEYHFAYGQVFYVLIDGSITDTDSDVLLQAREKAASADLRMVFLNSEGGNLNASIQMGRLLRELEFDAVILPDSVCYSACVFLLASSIDKSVEGRVGIHRPYFETAGSGSILDEIKNIKSELELYLEEMNIPANLAEDMFSIEPNDMRILTDNEMQNYRLNIKDYAAQEADTVRMMEIYGKTRSEYEAFRQDLNYNCEVFMGSHEGFARCSREVSRRHGITMMELP